MPIAYCNIQSCVFSLYIKEYIKVTFFISVYLYHFIKYLKLELGKTEFVEIYQSLVAKFIMSKVIELVNYCQ